MWDGAERWRIDFFEYGAYYYRGFGKAVLLCLVLARRASGGFGGNWCALGDDGWE